MMARLAWLLLRLFYPFSEAILPPFFEHKLQENLCLLAWRQDISLHHKEFYALFRECFRWQNNSQRLWPHLPDLQQCDIYMWAILRDKVYYYNNNNPHTEGNWGSIVVKVLRYQSDGPGIDSRWCHWGFFPWNTLQNHVPWGRVSLWKWVPGISLGVKVASAFGWQPTTLVVPKRQDNQGS